MTNDVNFWISIVTTAIGIITTIITIIINKSKSKSQKLVELAKIVQKLPGYIQEAETIFGTGTGTAKMAYVLNKVQLDCIQNKVEYSEEQFKGEIENILATPEKKETVDKEIIKRMAPKNIPKIEEVVE